MTPAHAILFFGGISEERLVSVASAQNLAAQYDFNELIFQARDEKLYRVAAEELQGHPDAFTREFRPQGVPFAESLAAALPEFSGRALFLALHGAQGENGELQRILEGQKIAFTGSGSRASHLAFEKDLAKKTISSTGIPLAAEIRFAAAEAVARRAELENFLGRHGKIVFKPTASGSSFGLHIVSDGAELARACAAIAQSGFETYLAESFIQGRELTIGVLQGPGGALTPLPASEVVLQAGHAFDYEGKYLGAGSQEITPALLTAAELADVQNLAMRAHRAFGCYGYSRTDVILSAQGAYFLETNTLPGLSRASFLPQQLLAADLTFGGFIAQQLDLALQRYE